MPSKDPVFAAAQRADDRRTMNAFDTHLDACERCRTRPFDLCATGVHLLEQQATGRPGVAFHEEFTPGEILLLPAQPIDPVRAESEMSLLAAAVEYADSLFGSAAIDAKKLGPLWRRFFVAVCKTSDSELAHLLRELVQLRAAREGQDRLEADNATLRRALARVDRELHDLRGVSRRSSGAPLPGAR